MYCDLNRDLGRRNASENEWLMLDISSCYNNIMITLAAQLSPGLVDVGNVTVLLALDVAEKKSFLLLCICDVKVDIKPFYKTHKYENNITNVTSVLQAIL